MVCSNNGQTYQSPRIWCESFAHELRVCLGTLDRPSAEYPVTAPHLGPITSEQLITSSAPTTFLSAVVQQWHLSIQKQQPSS